MGIQEKIKELDDELHRTQKNKATEYHIGIIKSKLAKLRRELIAPSKGGSSGGGGFDVKKNGDATVAMIGMPSVGKSTLLTKLTNAESKIAAYAFTTLKCIPGMMVYNDAKIQILDLPGIIEGAKEGRGRGREVIAVARSADLLLIMLDAAYTRQYELIVGELEGFGIRVNKKPPDITVKKIPRGGININSTVKLTKISEKEILAVANEYGMFNGNILFRHDATVDDFIDAMDGNRVYIQALVLINKIDLVGEKSLKSLPFDYIPISAEKGTNIEALRERIHRSLKFIKLFTKRRGEKADLEEPLIVKKGITVGEVCDKLHRDLRKEFKYALVWGKSVKHAGQRIGLDHILEDGDIVSIVKK
ncbi:MAG: GTP-binding protein [Candidatus Micrarchaeota archaeon]|nr:GTP-binding protein [Candidatus Micrarchaeota archaeon]